MDTGARANNRVNKVTKHYWQTRLCLSLPEYKRQKKLVYDRIRQKWQLRSDLNRKSSTAVAEVRDWLRPLIESLEINSGSEDAVLTEYAEWALIMNSKSKDELKGKANGRIFNKRNQEVSGRRKRLLDLEDNDTLDQVQQDAEATTKEHDIDLTDLLDNDFMQTVGIDTSANAATWEVSGLQLRPTGKPTRQQNDVEINSIDDCSEDIGLISDLTPEHGKSIYDIESTRPSLKLTFRRNKDSWKVSRNRDVSYAQPEVAQPAQLMSGHRGTADGLAQSSRTQPRAPLATTTRRLLACETCNAKHYRCDLDENSANGSCNRCTKAGRLCSNSLTEGTPRRRIRRDVSSPTVSRSKSGSVLPQHQVSEPRNAIIPVESIQDASNAASRETEQTHEQYDNKFIACIKQYISDQGQRLEFYVLSTLYDTTLTRGRIELFEASRIYIGTNASLMAHLAKILRIQIPTFNWSNIHVHVNLLAVGKPAITLPMKVFMDELVLKIPLDPTVDIWILFLNHLKESRNFMFHDRLHDFTWHATDGKLLGGFFTRTGLRKVFTRFEKCYSGDNVLHLRCNVVGGSGNSNTQSPSEAFETSHNDLSEPRDPTITPVEASQIQEGRQNSPAIGIRPPQHSTPKTPQTQHDSDPADMSQCTRSSTQSPTYEPLFRHEPSQSSQVSHRTPRKSLWKSSVSQKDNASAGLSQRRQTPETQQNAHHQSTKRMSSNEYCSPPKRLCSIDPLRNAYD